VSLGTVGPADEPFSGRVWLRKFPHGDVELLYKSGRSPSELEQLNTWLDDAGVGNRVTRLAPPGYAARTDKPVQLSDETNAERAARRARQAVRWSVKAIGCDQMLTLTYRENVTDYAESRRHFARFVAMCRKEWPTFRYVAAPEVQPERLERTGVAVWHWHVAVRGFVNYDKLRGLWWRAIGCRVVWSSEGKPVLSDRSETPGNVQGVSARVRGRQRRSWASDRLAGYLAKYIGKSIGSADVDGKSYSVSRGLVWQTERYAVRAFTYASVCGSVFELLAAAGVQGPHMFPSPDRVCLWAAGRRAAEPARPDE
jgi:hypothetical protein